MPTINNNFYSSFDASGVYTEGSLDSGDTAWMIFCTAIVLIMAIPGLAIFYGGMLRTKNVLACIMQIMTITCWVTFLWMVFGYSLAFSPAQPNGGVGEVFGNGDRLWLRGMMINTAHMQAPTIPEALFCAFQLTFAIVTASIICGSFADRMKYHSMIIFITFWHMVVYCPLAHSEWHPQGWLYKLGVLDFAGGNVVHISSGVSGLATVMVIGNRKGFGTEKFEPHNILFTFVGMSLLWVGWYGFNGGSSYGANALACYAVLNTQIAAASAALMWMLTEWGVRKQPSILGMINGAIAGLVCITPAAGFVDTTGAFFIGFFGGPLCFLGSQLKHYFGFDDALDAFGLHAIGGIIGGIATGFFATDQLIAEGWGDQAGIPITGVYYGGLKAGGHQLAIQLVGICFTIGWAFTWTYCILQIIDKTIGLRVSEEDEEEGLDSSIHGEKLTSIIGTLKLKTISVTSVDVLEK